MNPYSSDRKVLLIIWPQLAVIVILLLLAGGGMRVLSAARAYVTGESLWSKAQKEAVGHLGRYAASGLETDYERYRSSIAVNLGDRKARLELAQPAPDIDVAHAGFIEGRNHVDDVAGMIMLFRYFRRFSYMAQAVEIWTRADELVLDLDAAAKALHAETGIRPRNEARIKSLLLRIDAINAGLTPLEEEFSYTLGEASRKIQVMFIATGLMLAALLAAISVKLSRQMLERLQQAKDRLDLALKASRLSTWDWDARSGNVHLDAAWTELLGAEQQASIATIEQLAALVHPEDVDHVREVQADCMRGLSTEYVEEHRVRNAHGEWNWILSRGKVVERDADGKAVRMTGINLDISERKRAELALAAGEARFRALTELSSDWYWEQNEQYRFTLVSGASLEQIDGKPLDSYYGKQRWDFPALNLSEVDWDKHRAILEARQPFHDLVIKRLDACGTARHLAVSGVPYFDERGHFRGYRGVGSDVTAKMQTEQDILHMAHHDALTGLPNRILLQDRIEQAVAHAHRNRYMMAVLFVDLDHFKAINDSLGHQTGDMVLKTVAGRMSGCLREADTVGRLGGDEFLVVMPDVRDGMDAALVAQKLIDALSLPIQCDGKELRIGASVGISVYPADGVDCQNLMLNADIAMYNAKENCRGNYQFFTPRANFSTIDRTSPLPMAGISDLKP